jgi:hypothetical protein
MGGGKLKMGANKLEAFTIEVVNRKDIHEADYNPRKISEAARKKLQKFLKEHGSWCPLILNKRTMTLVSGHQRLSIMDTVLKKDDYELTMSVVDVDEKTEISGNVFMNNQSAMGEWDISALQDLHVIMPDIDFVKDFGFDESEIDIMLSDFIKKADTGDDQPLIDLVHEAKKSAEDFRQMKKEQRDKAKERDAENPQDAHELSSLDYTLTVVFPNNREKADFMRKIKKDPKEKFIKSTVLFDISKGVYNLSVLEK